MKEWIVVVVLAITVGTVTAFCTTQAECANNVCANMICVNGSACPFPCTCHDPGTGTGVCR